MVVRLVVVMHRNPLMVVVVPTVVLLLKTHVGGQAVGEESGSANATYRRLSQPARSGRGERMLLEQKLLRVQSTS